MLPNLSLLEQISQKIQNIPNQQGESKRKIHYCCFLLGWNFGLRISEAVKFDLNSKTRKGLYRIEKPKGKKERLVYIPKQIINELKKQNWKPNQTNRFNFYHFLKRVKSELNILSEVELTPHTLRRAFATYYAEAGLPLPLLQKLLGHKSIRTTALYWRNIYNEDEDDGSDIITVKNWLEKPKKPQPKLEFEIPIKVNLDKLPEPLVISSPPSNYLNKIQQLEEQLSQIQSEKNQKIVELEKQNASLQNDLANLSQQNNTLQQAKVQAITEKEQVQQNLTQAQETIKQLEQKLITTENNFTQEKQINSNLHQQFQTEQEKNNKLQEINTNLTQKLNHQKQNHTNLINTYQITLKDKAKIEALAQSQKQRADYYKNQLKSIAQTLHQWQKINYYQQIEKEQKCSIVQTERPPPWKSK